MDDKGIDISIIADGINQRIMQFLNAEGFRLGEFADKLGIPRSRMTHIKNNRNKPNIDFIIKMLYTFKNLNPEWLLLGEGSMYKVPPHKIIVESEPEPEPEPSAPKETVIENETSTENKTDKTTAPQNLTESGSQNDSEGKNNSEKSSEPNSTSITTEEQQSDKTFNKQPPNNQCDTQNNQAPSQPAPAIITGPDGLPQQILILYPDRTFVAYKARDDN